MEKAALIVIFQVIKMGKVMVVVTRKGSSRSGNGGISIHVNSYCLYDFIDFGIQL